MDCSWYKPKKAVPNRVIITVGGNRLEYYGEMSTETISIETEKILINSVLSTKMQNSCELIYQIFTSKQT